MATSTRKSPSKSDGADFEPDEEWKLQLRERIELGVRPMVQDSKDRQLAGLKRIEDEFKAAMSNIKALADQQYQLELTKERNQRRWIAGDPMDRGWS
ncbi:hypothetical protein BDZ97DRAFT_1683327, partial [Flammula alnicola]